jgi:peptide deformylase
MIRTICRMGNPILRRTAQEVKITEIKSDHFSQLLEDLHDSMKHYGGIGIAAPQIGVSLQVALIDLPRQNRYGEELDFPATVFINPQITVLSADEQGYWEGCLSVPGLRGYVERPQKIEVKYFDQNGEAQSLVAEGFLSTVLQHELDHLFGKLYIDRIKDLTLLSFQAEYDTFVQNSPS